MTAGGSNSGESDKIPKDLTYEELHEEIHRRLGINRYLDNQGLLMFAERKLSD